MVDAQVAAGDKMSSAGEVEVSLPPMRKLENAEGLFCDMIANYRERKWNRGRVTEGREQQWVSRGVVCWW